MGRRHGKPPSEKRLKQLMGHAAPKFPKVARTQALSIRDEERKEVAIHETVLRLNPGTTRSTALEMLAHATGRTLQTERRLSEEGTNTKVTPDEAHFDRLRGYHEWLVTIVGVLDVPDEVLLPGFTLLLELEDLMSGRKSELLQPVTTDQVRPKGDPARDWFARAFIVLGAEAVYRVNGHKSYPKAFMTVLEAIDAELKPFGIRVWDALPGRASKGPGGDQENREDVSECSRKLTQAAQRCERHRDDFESALPSIPSIAREAYSKGIEDLDAAEKRGAFSGLSSKFVRRAGQLLRMSWGREDAERGTRA